MLDSIKQLEPITDQAILNEVAATPLREAADPTRRFGYNPCIPNLSMSPSGSGLNSPIIEPGKLLMFVPKVQYHRGQFNPLARSADGKSMGVYPRITTNRYPGEFARAVARQFQFQKDFGYRNLDVLTPLSYQVTVDGYFDEAYKYWDVVFRKTTCEFGLETFVSREHGDDTFQPCPTCRIADLESTDLQQTIQSLGKDMDVTILENLRLKLIEANQASIRHITRYFDELEAEMELAKTGGVGRRYYTESDKYFQKMLHRKPAGDQQVSLLQQTIQANAQMIQTAVANNPMIQQNVVPAGQVAMSTQDYQEYLDMKAKKEAAQSRMANARAAKSTEEKNESNNTGGNLSEPERVDG